MIEFIATVIGATLRIATPLLLAGLGETVIERAGILNLGIEGTLMLSAFTGFLAAQVTGSLAIGLLAALLTGAALGVLMGLLTVTLGLNQHVSGLGITLFATGLALYVFRLRYGGATNPPTLEHGIPQWTILAGTPLEPILSQYWITYAALALVPILGWALMKTTLGLRIRAVGENPEAADMAGIDVYAMRYLALIIGGALIGAGGAFLSLAQLGAFAQGIISGRGWVAIAIVIFGNWQPSRVLIGALLFGGLQALQLRLQAEGVQLPYEALLALPYVITIVVLALAGRNASYPAALLKAYRREG